MIRLVVQFNDGSPDFIVGAVANDAEADAWEAHARLEPGWKPGSIVLRIPQVPDAPVVPDQAKAAVRAQLRAMKAGDIKSANDAEAAILKLIQALL